MSTAYASKRKAPPSANQIKDLAEGYGWSIAEHWGTTQGYTPFYRLVVAVRDHTPLLPYCHVVMVWHTETYPAVLKIDTKVYRRFPGGHWEDMENLKVVENLIRTGSAKPGP